LSKPDLFPGAESRLRAQREPEELGLDAVRRKDKIKKGKLLRRKGREGIYCGKDAVLRRP